ncbi:MAG: BACON domain-containing protein [Alistipes sp.]|nr:BACON domain-containing protein [Alistipes sp.]
MKLRNFFYLLLALPLVFAACENGSEGTDKKPDVPEVKDPVLTLTSSASMEVAAEGGDYVITYKLENAKEGVTLEATCEAAWVTDLTAGETVTFTVAANEETAPRETTIVVTYETQKFEVAVKQVAKDEVPAPVLTLTSDATMEFTAEGGAGEITYKLENAVEGTTLTATCEAEWVKDVAAGETVTFTVAANDGDAREAKVVVAYGEQKFEVTVKQAKKAEDPLKVFTKAESTWKGSYHTLVLTTEDQAVKLAADIYTYNSKYCYLYEGTYTVKNSGISFTEGEIDFYYSYITINEEKAALDSGTITVAINDDLTYDIAVDLKDANGRELKGEFKGAVEGMSFENGFEWVAASRNTTGGATDGQFNITFKTAGTDYADYLTLDFYAEAGATKLPAGTYAVANSTEAGNVNLSTLSFTTFSYDTIEVDGGEVVVESLEDNTYKVGFRMTEKDSRRVWVCSYEGEIYDMEVAAGATELNFVSANGYYSGDSGESYVYLVADNNKQLKLNLLDLAWEKAYITPGTYTVSSNWAGGSIYGGWYGTDWNDGVGFKSGNAIFEDNGDSTYTINVDITLTNDESYTGVYVGAIEGYTLPNNSDGGDTSTNVELTIESASGKAYSTSNYGVMLFTPGSDLGTTGAGQDIAYVNLDLYNLDSTLSYVAAGTYEVGGTGAGELDKAYTKISYEFSEKFVTDGWVMFDINDDKTYTITFDLNFEDGRNVKGTFTGNIEGITVE